MSLSLADLNPFVRYVHAFAPAEVPYHTPYRPLDARCFYLRRGRTVMTVEGISHTLEAGHLLLLAAGNAYIFSAFSADAEMLGINFDYTREGIYRKTPVAPVPADRWRESDCTEQPSAPFFAPLITIATSYLADILQRLEEVCSAAGPESDALSSAYLKLLLAHLAVPRVGTATAETTERVIAYIHAHHAAPLTNADIGKALGFHPNYLNRLVRQSTGKSLHDYLCHHRLTCAARLLQTTALPIGEIAIAVGFGDPQQFSKAFRRRFGCPPAAYRKIF